MIILRLKYKKEKNLKFISHLELMKTVERIFRRMALPLKFSQGYNPHPKMSFAAPLPVGVSSESEFMDVELTEKVHLKEFLRTQGEFMPSGLEFTEGVYLDKTKSLMSLVTSSEYVLHIKTETAIDSDLMAEKIKGFLELKEIIQSKKNKKGKIKETNVRERIYSVDYMTSLDDAHVIRTKLKTGSDGNLKPEVMIELLDKYMSMGVVGHSTRIHRIGLMGKDGEQEIDLLTGK